MRLLVTGGAGYIGSVVAAQLIAAGHEVTVLDDLSTGPRRRRAGGRHVRRGRPARQRRRVLAGGIDAVLHFAAKSLVGESVAHPGCTGATTSAASLALLEAMRVADVRTIVFSSTAATYGEPESVPVEETAPTRPTSPYGASKLAVDTALAEYARMHGFGAVSLRYFNVAGAFRDAAGTWLGERHTVETHLIPNVLRIARDDAGPVSIFGDDYPTADGSCIRDYIHVTDLASAHLLALEACSPGQHTIYNLGCGTGYSNFEVLARVPRRDRPGHPGQGHGPPGR